MEKAFRWYLFTSMALTIAALILFSIVGLGCTDKNNGFLDDLYFIQVNASVISRKNGLIESPEQLHQGSDKDRTSIFNRTIDTQEFYDVGLWNYCFGIFENKPNLNGKKAFKPDEVNDKVSECIGRTVNYWFDPIKIWRLNQTEADTLIGQKSVGTLQTYKKAVKWRSSAYIIGVMTTSLEFISGFFVILSYVADWRRFFTPVLGTVAMVGVVSSFFITAFALTSTILYGIQVKTLNHALAKYHIHSVMGFIVYIFLWLAVIVSWAAYFFWLHIWRSYRLSSPVYPRARRRAAKSDPEEIPLTQQNIQNFYMGGIGAPAYQDTVLPETNSSPRAGRRK